MAGVPEIQELQRASELRSQLRTVSEAGPGGAGAGQGTEVPPCRPLSWASLPSAGRDPLRILPQPHGEAHEPEQPGPGAGEEPGSGT